MMVAWVPVLGQDHMLERRRNAVDHRHYFLSSGDSQCSAIAEVILHVDHEQNITVCKLDPHGLETIAQMRGAAGGGWNAGPQLQPRCRPGAIRLLTHFLQPLFVRLKGRGSPGSRHYARQVTAAAGDKREVWRRAARGWQCCEPHSE